MAQNLPGVFFSHGKGGGPPGGSRQRRRAARALAGGGAGASGPGPQGRPQLRSSNPENVGNMETWWHLMANIWNQAIMVNVVTLFRPI